MMELSKDTIAGRTLGMVVYVAVLVLLAAGILLGLWTAEEMNAVVTEQFNAQQMTIAQTARSRIEREIAAIRSELDFLSRTLPSATHASEEIEARMKLVMKRLEPLGLRRVALIATASGEGMGKSPLRIERGRLAAGQALPEPPSAEAAPKDEPVFFGPTGRFLHLAAFPSSGGGNLRLEFHVDAEGLLGAILGPIRSGKSGYA